MPSRLLSIAEARDVVRASVAALGAETTPVAGALGRVLAEDVLAAHDVPPFPNSAMDGFAVRAGAAGRTLAVVGESRAGAPAQAVVGDGEAVRISTGAVLPAGADTVLQVELVDDEGDRVTLRDAVAPGRNVRSAGEDLHRGERALARATRLGPAALGVAVTAGRTELRVGRRPRVAIVATGDELAAPGAPLAPGHIHNSNSVALAALAATTGAQVAEPEHAADSASEVRAALGAAVEDADVLVVSGGVSVGPHDHVKAALVELGVRERFWRVALRPGKPTWFGTRGETLVFGLPGNPVSALVTFHLFARAALLALQGAPFAPAAVRTAVLDTAVPRSPGRDEAVRVRLATDERGVLTATPAGPQGSHQLSSLLGADGLAIVSAGEGSVAAGTPIAVELLAT